MGRIAFVLALAVFGGALAWTIHGQPMGIAVAVMAGAAAGFFMHEAMACVAEFKYGKRR